MAQPPFTRIPDLDMKMLQELDDHDLYDICLVNKYAATLCNNENFWRNRFMKRFAPDLLSGKPSEMSWKEYYIELSDFEELKRGDKLYHISITAKHFFNSVDLGEYLGKPLTDNLIEKAGISSKNNLRRLFTIYAYRYLGPFRMPNPDFEYDFGNFFDIEHERLGITKEKLSVKNVDKLISLLLAKPLKTGTLLYAKMYNLNKKEQKILDEIKN